MLQKSTHQAVLLFRTLQTWSPKSSCPISFAIFASNILLSSNPILCPTVLLSNILTSFLSIFCYFPFFSVPVSSFLGFDVFCCSLIYNSVILAVLLTDQEPHLTHTSPPDSTSFHHLEEWGHHWDLCICCLPTENGDSGSCKQFSAITMWISVCYIIFCLAQAILYFRNTKLLVDLS
jgi:hypothetical protein